MLLAPNRNKKEKSITETDGSFFKHLQLEYLGSGGHPDIGCQIQSSTTTPPCVSSLEHHTRSWRSCASRLRSASPLHLYPLPRSPPRRSVPLGAGILLRAAQRSERKSSASMLCVRPIAYCSLCWSGAGLNSTEPCQNSSGLGFLLSFEPDFDL